MKAALVSLLLLSGPAPELKLRIEAPDRILRPGQRMPLRFTLENASESEAKLDEPDNYLEGLEIWDPEDKVVKPAGKTRGITKRSLSVEPGGFIGRTVDVSAALIVPPEREGWHRIRWHFGEGVSNEIRVFVIRDWLATLETNHGSVTIEFLPQLAPNHVLNFLGLARRGFYDGTVFHRLIPGFMVQGGGPREPSQAVKTSLKAEFSDHKHGFGTVSMARTNDPDSATSQFFICFGPASHLDRVYSVFGQVVKGDEVVKEIEKVRTDHSPCRECKVVATRPGSTRCCGTHHQDKPESDVVLKKVTLSERKK